MKKLVLAVAFLSVTSFGFAQSKGMELQQVVMKYMQ